MKKRIILIILIVLTLLAFALNMHWLGIILILHFLLIILYLWLNKRYKIFSRVKFLKGTIVLLYVFIVSIFLRLFVVEVFQIPSGSMKDTLVIGDIIAVNKLAIGPKTPKSPFEIPWINILFYLKERSGENLDSVWWPTKRLRGYSEIQRNDVLVFNRKPVGQDFLIKRCVALPCDTFEIINSFIYTNGQLLPEVDEVKKEWEIYSSDSLKLSHILDSLQNNVVHRSYNNKSSIHLKLTNEQTYNIKQLLEVDSLRADNSPLDNKKFYPSIKKDLWSIDNYGPIIIPNKGMKIFLNEENFGLYNEMILKWENKKIELKNGHYYIEDSIVQEYTFQFDYLFFMGDNRYASFDSRMLGIVPQQKVVGKANLILWSYRNELDWNRILKRIK